MVTAISTQYTSLEKISLCQNLYVNKKYKYLSKWEVIRPKVMKPTSQKTLCEVKKKKNLPIVGFNIAINRGEFYEKQ